MSNQVYSAEDWIKHLGLQAHPEGGWYREVYRSELVLPASAMPSAFGGSRSALTSIYYLLERGDFSAFHRIQSDELWYHLAGSDCLVHTLQPGQGPGLLRLSSWPSAEGQPQGWVPAGAWFASEPDPEGEPGWFLCACAVAPGFDFADFEMAKRAELEKTWPEQGNMIQRLTRS